ncbi:LytR/AlgR family response regulator transcription factor [Velocimicrobium porci]|uniref:Stage 0 sporulation protein A homolog n=1 Tax=Velocimicrobium porci TaxID=2606634 RepID=A0A6L5XVV5_9FIRM|nr:LytTR family DNA-binding domain-containing protein [Velocimicrobium porci]MSS62724.1 response regulator transcription factor [Velocimicrobium porci]
MFKIAVCDDDCIITSKVETLLLELAKKKGMVIEVDIYFDGSTLASAIDRGESYDLIYLDIEMTKQDGITTAKQVRKKDQQVLLIYISSHETYWKELFEVEPFRFLSKPIDISLFEDYFYKALDKISQKMLYFTFSFRKQMNRVKIGDICYFESKGRIIYVVLKDNTKRFYGKLNQVEAELEKMKVPFLRIHQSYLVNCMWIQTFSFTQVILTDGTVLYISEERQKAIRRQYCILLNNEELVE